MKDQQTLDQIVQQEKSKYQFRFPNLKSNILSFAASILMSLGINMATNADERDLGYVDRDDSVVISEAVEAPDPNCGYLKWMLTPRSPTINQDYVAWSQLMDPEDAIVDPNGTRIMTTGDIQLLNRDTGEIFPVTNNHFSHQPDLCEENPYNLVFHNRNEDLIELIYKCDLRIYPHPASTQLISPIEQDQYGRDIHCISPEIHGNFITWISYVTINTPRKGYPYSRRRLHKGVYAYNIPERSLFTIINRPYNITLDEEAGIQDPEEDTSTRYPKLRAILDKISLNYIRNVHSSGDWLVMSMKDETNQNNYGASYNPYAYHFPTGQLIRIEDDPLNNCEQVVVYHDKEGTDEAIIAYGMHGHGISGSANKIVFKRLKAEGADIIVDPEPDWLVLPDGNKIETEWLTCWHDIHGRPGLGPVIVWGDYAGVKTYSTGPRIRFWNLGTGNEGYLTPGGSWKYSPKIFVDVNGDGFSVWGDDAKTDGPGQDPEPLLLMMDSTSVLTQAYAALDSNFIVRVPDNLIVYPKADTNYDGIVDLLDLVLLYEQWLASNCSWQNAGVNDCGCNGADLNKDTKVDSLDYKILENWWLASADPPSDPHGSPPEAVPDVQFAQNLIENWDLNDGYYDPYYDYGDPNFVPPEPELYNIFSYTWDDLTFGVLGGNKVELPASGNIEFVPEGYDYYYWNPGDNQAKNWSVTYDAGKVTLESLSEETDLNAGDKVHINIRSQSPLYGQMYATLYTDQGPLEYLVTVPLEKTLRADLSNDGIADIYDVLIIASQWLEQGTALSADMNNDNSVNILDLSVFSNQFLSQEAWYGQAQNVQVSTQLLEQYYNNF